MSTMGASVDHYDDHLGETYAWMCGGVDAAVRAGREEIASLGLPARRGDLVVDLGCGFGKHAIPLAAAGARVVAIDASRAMLDLLRAHLPAGADVCIVHGDVVDELGRMALRPDAIVCLGDTLTHLSAHEDVERLLRSCAQRLAPGGRLALAFRDYSTWEPGETRRFEVRTDEHRRVECAVTVLRDHVEVEDLVSERVGCRVALRSHSYRKLRLAPAAIEELLRSLSLDVERPGTLRGVTRMAARRS